MSAPGASFVPATAGRTFAVLGDRITCKTGGAETAGAWALFEVEAPLGSAVPLHRHAWDEGYYVLDGELEFDLPQGTERAGPGAYVRVAGGSPHSVRSAAGKSARYLLWASPCGAEAFFEELARASREEGFGLERVLAVAAKHGIEVLPPRT